jgi:eukaryotic-like serine/threonine-protein kinase
MSAVPVQTVQKHLEEILASASFASSERLRRLLRYLVEKTLSKEATGLKEYAIGLDVFDRGIDYNPQVDSTVRVHVGKLRDKLREYYLTDGRDSEIRIDLQKGSYVPTFLPGKTREEKSPRKAFDVGRQYALPIAAIVILILIGVIVVLLARPGKIAVPRSRTIRFTIAGPDTAAAFPLIEMPAVSQDGRRVVFTTVSADGQRRLAVRAFDTLETKQLVGTENGYAPFWSPDSHDLGFFAAGKLKRIAISGGPAQELSDAELGWGGSWNQDNVILFASGRQSAKIRRVSALGGLATSATILNPGEGEQSHTWPQFLPDGKHFLVFVRSAKPRMQGIYVGQLSLNSLTLLMNSDYHGLYAEPGYLLFMLENSLMAQSFDPNRLRLSGAPSVVASGVQIAPYNPGFGYVKTAFYSAGGAAVVVRKSPLGPSAAAYWFSRDGTAPQRLLGDIGEVNSPAISPDGKMIVYSKGAPDTQRRDIWMYDISRSAASRFTFDPADDLNPTWSPDGRRIAFTSDRKGVRDIYLKDINGAAAEELLLETEYEKNVEAWSPDGRYILFNQVTPNHERELWAVAATRGSEPFAVVAESKPVRKGVFSPNGRFLAYVSGESGQDEVYVRPFPKGGRKWQLTRQGGLDPRWSRDGRELFYITGHSFVSVQVDLSGDACKAGPPHELFTFLPAGIGRNACDAARDGRHFLCVTQPDTRESTPLIVVLNWSLPIER